MRYLLVPALATCLSFAFLAMPPAQAYSSKARAMARTLSVAPPPALRAKRFSLHTIKRRHDLRRFLRGVDIDSINFRFNSAVVDPSEAWKLADLADAFHLLLRRNPYEMFLIEGHTDAVGSAAYNRRLSERRAWNVVRVLARRYGVPYRAMTAQGYGERYLKIPVPYEERRNRRVTARRLTDILYRTRRLPPLKGLFPRRAAVVSSVRFIPPARLLPSRPVF